MGLGRFRYELPEALIAQYPVEPRTASRLLCVGAARGDLIDRIFADLPELLRPGDLLIGNDTRVIPARLFGRKESGGAVEILIERVLADGEALAQIRASKSPRPGGRIRLDDGSELEVQGRAGAFFRLRSLAEPFPTLLRRLGHVPLPPYIRRADETQDGARYQTVYATRDGAVAAPTAGLHFDTALLARLAERGVEFGRGTLHVGAGTFQPIRVESLAEHVMHEEVLQVSPELCAQVAATRARGGRVVAIGTTVVRALETAALGGTLGPFDGTTRLFIRPWFRFRVVDALLTNFHLPESTLLLLVCAFGGYARVLRAYRHAVAAGYRFFSYGDAMWLPKCDDRARRRTPTP
ncbi:MAG: tRNA preQ1(34) S-adenosylmethionine ribosyltransferase-isomerase QueA [Gammaproteobacteria bacterium]|nr:tRNA preQ1(34) S-adenosylmethionine ribosyltransferase-isomerase QueA [Gammaproteobacteria bacterium]